MYDFISSMCENPMKAVEIAAIVLMAIATVVLACFTRRLVLESKASRKDAKKPRLSAKLKPQADCGEFIDLVICNVGKGTALNVSFHLEELDEKDFERYGIEVRGTSSPINFLVSNESEICIFGAVHILFAQRKDYPPLEHFTVKLEYKDTDGKRYEETCRVDSRQLDGLAWQGKSAAWRQMVAIEKIAEFKIPVERLSEV